MRSDAVYWTPLNCHGASGSSTTPIALLLRAWQLRVGPLRGKGKSPLRYRHIVLDEVQDFSPLEVRVLLDCLDRRRSMTLVVESTFPLGLFTARAEYELPLDLHQR